MSLSRQATFWAAGAIVRLRRLLPLAALASGEVLWNAGAERGARGRWSGTLSLCSAQETLGALPPEACSHAIDASGVLSEGTSADG